MSVKGHGLFSEEFTHPNQYQVQACGDILSIDRTYDEDFGKYKVLTVNSSFYYLTFLRDSVSLVNFVPNCVFWLDVIVLPGFQMYDDTGTVSTTYPTSAELGFKYYFLKNEKWICSLSAQGGMEFIPDYNYMFNPVYGLYGNMGYSLMDGLLLGFTAGSSDFMSVYLEAGCRWTIGEFGVLGAFALDGNYKTFKAGFTYRVAPGFSVLWGGNYTLEYNGWSATGGIEISKFKMFHTESRAGLAVAYNFVGGISVTLSLNMLFDKNPPPGPLKKDGKEESRE